MNPRDQAGLTRSTRALACAAAVLLAAACGKQETAPAQQAEARPVAPVPAVKKEVPKPLDVAITGVHLGKGFDQYHLIARETSVFGPKERVDASVYSDGTAKTANIRIAWLDANGRVIAEETRAVAYNGSQATPFSLGAEKGLAPGKYRVEVYLNDWKASTASFEVR